MMAGYLIDKLSVFLPAYNEEENIEKTVEGVKRVLKKVAGTWEIIIIDDGSKDRTGEIIRKLARQDKRIRVISHSSNKGYGAALTSGFYGARYPWIAFCDSDGQFDFGEITKFIRKQRETGAEAVIGFYQKRQVPRSVEVTSELWEALVWGLFGLKVKDIDCAFKMLSKRVINKIPKLESRRGAFISSELLIKVKRAGFRIEEVGVSHFPRASGAATGRNLNVIIESFWDLVKLRMKLWREACQEVR